jgi:hypothetical protein
MRVVERIAGHYEVQDVEFGKVYTWHPESVVAECECGQRATFERTEIIGGSASTCECGKDPTASIQEELVTGLLDEEEDDKVLHPWRYWHTSRNSGLPF